VELSLSEFSNLDLLPSRILLCGGGAALPEIKKVLEGNEWYKNLPFAKKPKISFIKPEEVTNMTDRTGEIKDQQDITPLGLGSLIVDMDIEDEVMPTVLQKVVRLMQN
jgi:cell division protein FtsA